jgi:Clp protease
MLQDSIIFNKYITSPIHTYCIGQAASMGSLLLCAGNYYPTALLKEDNLASRRAWKEALSAKCNCHDTPYAFQY